MRLSLLSVRKAVQALLLKVGPRPTAIAATLYLSLKHRQRCRVSHSNGMWLHHYPDGVLVQTVIGGHTVRSLDTATHRDVLMRYTPRPGDTVLDVGAGIGDELLTLSRLVGDAGRLISIEAHPRTFACLEEAVRRNHLRNVTVVHAAVSDADGEIRISDVGGTSLSNTVVAGDRGISVRAVTLDSLADELKIERVDFMKANIEGAERLMLHGMSRTIQRLQNASVSCHDFIADRTGDETYRTKASVKDYFSRHGFSVTERQDDRPEMADTLYFSRSGGVASATEA